MAGNGNDVPEEPVTRENPEEVNITGKDARPEDHVVSQVKGVRAALLNTAAQLDAVLEMTSGAQLGRLPGEERSAPEDGGNAPAGTLPGAGGSGTSGGMEERVARLEKNVDQIAKDIGDVRVDVATLKENVRHLPTKPWIFTALAGTLAALSVVMGMLIRFLPHAP